MNYRHIYHAGNFADVFKHFILTALIRALQRKDTPCCYIDTHAGIGFYDLDCPSAKRSGEYLGGISRILTTEGRPAILNTYLDCIRLANENVNSLQYYPGSPSIMRDLLRPQDRLILSELHPQDYDILRQLFRHDKQVAVHQENGYQILKAFLPPKERRGLVLIDPPFEDIAEFKALLSAIAMAIKLWETGVYAIWYPIKDRLSTTNFLRRLQRAVPSKVLLAELLIMPETTPLKLKGCGMAIINPPWQIEEQIRPGIQWLWKQLSPAQEGKCRVEWL